MQGEDKFTFNISLSVLNHLGRNLYRSFTTVLGEAISNSWDADARNVWLYIDKDKNRLFVKDDGIGMSGEDFQDKFLKIGYSKRTGGHTRSKMGRPYIGRKGIGKLALLSCAEKIHVISKTRSGEYIGGIIDNAGLDRAIKHDLTPDKYPLGRLKPKTFSGHLPKHKQGTIICFEKIREGVKHSPDFFKKVIALYFRFSLHDRSFRIYVNDEEITLDCLNELANKTQFLWILNKPVDPYITKLRKISSDKNAVSDGLKEERPLTTRLKIKGFIASVEKPVHLKIKTTDDQVSVDLFVNGRLRERNILKHIPTARVVESYLYGQIHFDSLDSGIDSFTSSRENIVADDPRYQKLLETLKRDVINKILFDWDTWRRKHKYDGDPDDSRLNLKERKAIGLFNEISKEYIPPRSSKRRRIVDSWLEELGNDATFNFTSYAECFISENLVRKFIHKNKIPTTKKAATIKMWRDSERRNKKSGNISVVIRQTNDDLSYLSMDDLAEIVDEGKDRIKDASLLRDAKEYKPMRDALAHTALLTDVAKRRLTSVYENIKERVKTLLSNKGVAS